MAEKNPIVTIEMNNGDVMKAELYPEVAPNTVNNFISLVNRGYYDGIIFHRVIRGFMIQYLVSVASNRSLRKNTGVLNLRNKKMCLRFSKKLTVIFYKQKTAVTRIFSD